MTVGSGQRAGSQPPPAIAAGRIRRTERLPHGMPTIPCIMSAEPVAAVAFCSCCRAILCRSARRWTTRAIRTSFWSRAEPQTPRSVCVSFLAKASLRVCRLKARSRCVCAETRTLRRPLSAPRSVGRFSASSHPMRPRSFALGLRLPPTRWFVTSGRWPTTPPAASIRRCVRRRSSPSPRRR